MPWETIGLLNMYYLYIRKRFSLLTPHIFSLVVHKSKRQHSA